MRARRKTIHFGIQTHKHQPGLNIQQRAPNANLQVSRDTLKYSRRAQWSSDEQQEYHLSSYSQAMARPALADFSTAR